MVSFVGFVMRARKMPTYSLRTAVPRVWNVPGAFWSCGQMKTFLVRGPSCFLYTLPQDPHANTMLHLCISVLSNKWACEGSICKVFYCYSAKVLLSVKNSVFRQGV